MVSMATPALHPTARAVVAVFSLAPLSEPTQQPYKSETNGLCNFLDLLAERAAKCQLLNTCCTSSLNSSNVFAAE